MDEDILVPLIMFSFILILIGMILNHSRWKYLQKQKNKGDESAGSGSLRTSELKALVMEAVIEANRPLHERIEELEAQVRRELQPRLNPGQQEEWPGEAEAREEQIPASRRTST